MTISKTIAATVCFVCLAGAAHAGFTVCNKSGHTQGVSIGYKQGANWVSEGWWNIKPGACGKLVGKDLTERYYYIRAEVNGGPFKGTSHYFCTTPSEYTIVGDEDCSSRGYDREDFREIDTGATAKDFTLNLN